MVLLYLLGWSVLRNPWSWLRIPGTRLGKLGSKLHCSGPGKGFIFPCGRAPIVGFLLCCCAIAFEGILGHCWAKNRLSSHRICISLLLNLVLAELFWIHLYVSGLDQLCRRTEKLLCYFIL